MTVPGRGLAAAAVLLAAASAQAGNISLSFTPRAKLRDAVLEVHLTVHNVGDDAARSVAPVLHFQGRRAPAEVVPRLEPGETTRVVLTLPVGDLGAGRWPYRVGVDYTDPAQHLLHALQVGTVVAGGAPPPEVAVAGLSTARLATHGALEARVENLGAEPRTVAFEVHLPEGIYLAESIPSLELGSFEERPVAISLVNRRGVPGSRYAVFVSAEYDDGGVHQTVVALGAVEIVPEQAGLQRSTLLWRLVGAIVALWGATAVGGHLARRRRRTRRLASDD